MTNFSTAAEAMQTLCVYQKLKENPLCLAFSQFCETANSAPSFGEVAAAYTHFCGLLYQHEHCGNFADALLELILCDQNAFTEAAAHSSFDTLPHVVLTAAKYELKTLYAIAHLSAAEAKDLLLARYPKHSKLIAVLPEYNHQECHFSSLSDWSDDAVIIAYHQQQGLGLYTKYHAFYFSEEQQVIPVSMPRTVQLEELKKYEWQKEKIVQNTVGFLANKPTSNVLLYGDRGTGKSTMVHAVLTTYAPQGLRMIQVAKEDALHLNRLIEALRPVPLHFIIFIDDLTFNENDAAFNTMKAVLEGSLNALPSHVRIYATTNRRHLIKETFSAREGNELHASDTRDESASLADRFGLSLTFTKPTLPEYLEIVCAIATDRGLAVSEDQLKRGAATFATRKGSRSGRVARQYIDELESRLALDLPV